MITALIQVVKLLSLVATIGLIALVKVYLH